MNKLITIFLTLLSALLLILSTAGFGASPLVFIGFIPLFFAIRRNNVHPLLLGWLLGFLYWFVGLFWMMITFSYYGNAPILGSLALLLFISISGGFLFFAPFAYVARKYGDQPLIMALVFIGLEAAKSALFFGGVPWLNLAQSQYKNLLFLQSVSIFGEYGLSLIIMLINIFIFYILIGYKPKINARYLAATFIIMILPGIYFLVSPIKYDFTKNIKVIQTGYKQEDKWVGAKRLDIINDLNARIMAVEHGKYDLIVLPESTFPAPALDTPFILDVLQDTAFHTPIIIGSDTKAQNNKLGKVAHYNSMVLFDDVNPPNIYNKRHLTPFGEYFPLEKLLYPLRVFFFGKGDMFTAGTEAKVFRTRDMAIAPIICWEGAFSNLLRESVLNGATIIAMISNDSWFGSSSGRYQHLAVDVVRAAEYQRSMARATQDGISAMVMPNGKIVKIVTTLEPAELDYELPVVSRKTVYTVIGYSYLFLVAIAAFVIYRKKKTIEK